MQNFLGPVKILVFIEEHWKSLKDFNCEVWNVFSSAVEGTICMEYIGDQLKGHWSDPGKRWWDLGLGWCWFLGSAAVRMVVPFTETVQENHPSGVSKSWILDKLTALFVRVQRREVKWEVGHLRWEDINYSLSLGAVLIKFWVGTDEFWDLLEPWHFMILCSLTFEVDMKESLYIVLLMSLYTNGNEIFLWMDFETYLL